MSTTIEGELTEIDLLALEFPDVPYLTLAELLHNYDDVYNQSRATCSAEKPPLRDLIPELMDLWSTFETVNDAYLQDFARSPYDSPAVVRFQLLDRYIRGILRSSCTGEESLSLLEQAEAAFTKGSDDKWVEYHIIELVWRLKFYHQLQLFLCSTWYERAKWSSSFDPRYPFTLAKISPLSNKKQTHNL